MTTQKLKAYRELSTAVIQHAFKDLNNSIGIDYDSAKAFLTSDNMHIYSVLDGTDEEIIKKMALDIIKNKSVLVVVKGRRCKGCVIRGEIGSVNADMQFEKCLEISRELVGLGFGDCMAGDLVVKYRRGDKNA